MPTIFNQVVLLNRLLSRSVTAKGQTPPLHSGEDLLAIVENQFKLGLALVSFGASESDSEANGAEEADEHDTIAISGAIRQTTNSAIYYVFLIEYVNANHKHFPVVSRKTRKGRELAGEPDERGAAAAHFVVRLPLPGAPDEGDYRCAIEYSPNVRRLDIEKLMCRILRTVAAGDEWKFAVGRVGKRGKAIKDAEYRYHPKLELAADIGRKLGMGVGRRQLAQIVFTKKLSQESIAEPTHVEYVEPFLADLEVRISGKQAPSDETEKRGWFTKVRDYYEKRGYTTKLYYRYPGGGTMSGDLDKAVAGAVDLVMCPKEYVELEAERPRWCSAIDLPFADRMKALLSDDSLWQRAQPS